jgi:hypothetical protein
VIRVITCRRCTSLWWRTPWQFTELSLCRSSSWKPFHPTESVRFLPHILYMYTMYAYIQKMLTTADLNTQLRKPLVGHEKVDKQSTATRLKSVVNLTLRRGDFLLVSGLSVLITTGFVWGSLSHPFLLADNRLFPCLFPYEEGMGRLLMLCPIQALHFLYLEASSRHCRQEVAIVADRNSYTYIYTHTVHSVYSA